MLNELKAIITERIEFVDGLQGEVSGCLRLLQICTHIISSDKLAQNKVMSRRELSRLTYFLILY